MREIAFINDDYINLEELNMLTIVVENKRMLFDLEKYIALEFTGKTKFFSLLIDKDPKEIDAFVDFVEDIFVLDLNTKKNINALYKILKNIYAEKLNDDLRELRAKAEKIVSEIAMDFELELFVNNEIKEDDLFKVMDLRFNDGDDTPEIRIIKYMETVHELRNIDIFFTFNLHRFFEKEEIEQILKEIAYRGIVIIDIEPLDMFERCQNERVIIYDSDLCIVG